MDIRIVVQSLLSWVRLSYAWKLGLMVALIASTVSLFCLPFYVIVVASSPIYVWKFLHCYGNSNRMMAIESIAPFFVLGAIFGFMLSMRPSFTVK
ncbi:MULTISPECIES: hypothetical protein [Ralstonia solanacearum species complex]|uniref:hypothetical protein n=1 Tax=Ralstonia solanacearum species complex TaxID=3116862 RepID=UPI00078E15E0|nr:hypothetical protein [Ralstonia solanacearum]BEU71130.1 hypothetical protein MAFF211271_06850 [Ralstonia pseudosolanacearum]AMP36676.1 hypothetical protein LBM2029_03605 [Ralstonia solanacearum]AXV76117.1 hypothetical protein CJO76_03510 [Ralstonia solanacearum]AXV85480.1 hypothetical protein CJO78_03775 [Ralstonia solanacearum]AXV90121.1 hypothetical protein CJO79_03510 [Ralstonia solanacearum]